MLGRTLGTVFRTPAYIALAAGVAALVFVSMVWLPNIRLIGEILSSETATSILKLKFMIGLLGSITTNFSVFSASAIIIISALFGINTALLAYYVRKVQKHSARLGKVGGTGLGGLIAGIFGVGCATCGTFLLSSILALVGAGGLLVYLPFGGTEFSVIGIALLAYTAYVLAREIEKPVVCLD